MSDLFEIASECNIAHGLESDDYVESLEKFKKMIEMRHREKLAQMMESEGWTYGAALIRTKGAQ